MRQIPTQTPPAAATPASKLELPPLSVAHAARWAHQPQLGVKRKLWRNDDDHAHIADRAFDPVRKQVIERDGYACRYCSHKTSKYQEVHHFDDDHSNNDPGNLLTICNLCHQVHHLGMCGMRNGGFIASIPELTQVEVNHIARAHFVVQLVGDEEAKNKLSGLYALFRSRADILKTAFGVDISSPLLLAEILSVCDESIYSQRDKLLETLRLVPTAEAFASGHLAHLAVNGRVQFMPEKWAAFTNQLVA